MMSILIVSKTPAIAELIMQFSLEVPELEQCEHVPEEEDAIWERISIAVIDESNKVRIAAISKFRQEGELFIDQKELSKPSHPQQLKHAIIMMLSLRKTQEESILKIGPYLLHVKGRYIMDQSKRVMVNLTQKEIGIINCLYDAQGKSCSKEHLLKQVWGVADGVDTRTVETHIYRLRQKLVSAMQEDNIILTDDAGYRLGVL